MSKQRDLAQVLAAFPLEGLIHLQRGFERGLVVHGRFTEGTGGCLLNLLSLGSIRSRDSMLEYCRTHALADEGTFKRVVRAWDAGHDVLMGVDYNKNYPDPGYMLEAHEVQAALKEAIAQRQAGEQAEERNLLSVLRQLSRAITLN